MLQEESAVRSYFADLAGSRPLSRAEEAELSDRISTGDLAARDRLVQANLLFVVNVAKRYQNRGLPLGDLIAAGNLGLMTAADRFDGKRGWKFISYAVWWIRQSIQQSIDDHARTVRLPGNRLSRLREINDAARRLEQQGYGEAATEAIAAVLKLSPEEVDDTLFHAQPIASLDSAYAGDEEHSLLKHLADEDSPSPDRHTEEGQAETHLEAAVSRLDRRTAYVLRLYYGLGGTEALTLEQIGQRLNLTRERVRQLKEAGLSQLWRLMPSLASSQNQPTEQG
jgi:RNA polymerase primary sigma factor